MNRPGTLIVRSNAIAAALLYLTIFLPAGTFKYWQAWVLIGVYAACGALLSIFTWKYDPALFAMRMKQGPQKEQSLSQRIIVTLLYAGFLGQFVVCAIDHRFGWSTVPTSIVIVGNAIVVLAYYVYFVVIRENSFASSTIEITAGQHVVSTGPYRIVRHPMYIGLLLLLLGAPLAMGALWGLAVFVAEIPVVLWRLLDEEQFLVRNLPGYAEYRSQTRWRLVPGVF